MEENKAEGTGRQVLTGVQKASLGGQGGRPGGGVQAEMRRSESRNFQAEGAAAAQALSPEQKGTEVRHCVTFSKQRAGCWSGAPLPTLHPCRGCMPVLSVPHSTARISRNGFYTPHLFRPVLGADAQKRDFRIKGAAHFKWWESLPEASLTAFCFFPFPTQRSAKKARLASPKVFASCCSNVQRPQRLPLAHRDRRGFLA